MRWVRDSEWKWEDLILKLEKLYLSRINSAWLIKEPLFSVVNLYRFKKNVYFFWLPSFFVKFFRPEHNTLNRSHTIRFGTLDYYRELDPTFSIADAEEGRESTDIVSADSDNASPKVKERLSILKGSNVSIR